MAFALWVVGAWFMIVYLGTFLLQLILWLLQAAFLVVRLAFIIVAGVVGAIWLLAFDRRAFLRSLRNVEAHRRVDLTLARERWS